MVLMNKLSDFHLTLTGITNKKRESIGRTEYLYILQLVIEQNMVVLSPNIVNSIYKTVIILLNLCALGLNVLLVE